jgi:glycosyltransferase involved in cell wall biosynthesis
MPDRTVGTGTTRGPLVSVITPVFNGAPYLAECLESVLAQSHRNWECAIVDNASTDETPEIAEQFAARDSRIRHLRFDEFVSATANHNRAFMSISPESTFCKVVQADDWMYPECLSQMIRAAEVSETVGVIGAYQLWGTRIHLDGLPYTTTFASGRDILRGTLLGRFNVTGGPTATMLRSAYVRERQPFWIDGFRHEDTEAVFWMLSKHDFAFVHQVLTFARAQAGSRITRSVDMNSAAAEDIVFLLRYGRMIFDGRPLLDDDEFRKRLRTCLYTYVWWHLRDLRTMSRFRDAVYFTFHEAKRSHIFAEARGDVDVDAATTIVGALLARGIAHTRSAPREPVFVGSPSAVPVSLGRLGVRRLKRTFGNGTGVE